MLHKLQRFDVWKILWKIDYFVRESMKIIIISGKFNRISCESSVVNRMKLNVIISPDTVQHLKMQRKIGGMCFRTAFHLFFL